MAVRDLPENMAPVEMSMADIALAKLLGKLGVVPANRTTPPSSGSERSPIAYFAAGGFCDELEAIKKVAQELNLEIIRLEPESEKQISKLLDMAPFTSVPPETWKRFKAIPVRSTESSVVIAMANPLDIDGKRSLEFALQRRVIVAVGAERAITELLTRREEGRDGLDFGSLLASAKPLELRNTSSEEPHQHQSTKVSEDIAAPTIVRVVNKVFLTAVTLRASDVHLSPQSDRLTVRVRVDGITRELFDIPLQLAGAVTSRIKVLCGMDIAEKRHPQDGRLRIKTSVGQRDLRVSTVPTVYGEDVVARILESEIRATTFEALGMNDTTADQLRNCLRRTSKVLLITGPTGSGKTSTLYAAVMHLRNGETRIITVEDPIEYRISGVSQIEVNTKAGMTFASALRSIVRQDPDVIFLGEIRDSETAGTVMQVAQTGHVVFSTMHTNTAAAAVTRLRDLGVPSFLVASSLGGVLAQRLVRTLCSACRGPVSGARLQRYEQLGLDADGHAEPRGCSECNNSGYKGRTGVFSLFDVTPELAQAIRDEVGEMELESIARRQNFRSLQEAGLDLLPKQSTSLEELERVLGVFERSAVSAKAPTNGVGRSMTNDESVETAVEQSPDEELSSVIPKRKVLIVDDDEHIRNILHSLLEFEMFDVRQADNGHKALEMIFQDAPEIVLADLMMPRMTGGELIERLRRDARTRNMPVLILTAAATPENELKLIQSGADDFISKTVRPELLVAKINRLLNRAE